MQHAVGSCDGRAHFSAIVVLLLFSGAARSPALLILSSPGLLSVEPARLVVLALQGESCPVWRCQENQEMQLALIPSVGSALSRASFSHTEAGPGPGIHCDGGKLCRAVSIPTLNNGAKKSEVPPRWSTMAQLFPAASLSLALG